MEYITDPVEYERNLKKKYQSFTTEDIIHSAMLSASCGIEVVSNAEIDHHHRESLSIGDPSVYSNLVEKLKTKKHVWIQDAPSTETEVLSPEEAERELLLNGTIVTVERAIRFPRAFSDMDYAVVGCTLVPSGSHKYCDNRDSVCFLPQ